MPLNAFKQGMQLNKRSFELGLFDAAYHFLAGALYIADREQSERGMIEVETTVLDQLAHIDMHHPDYHHSTKSSTTRNHSSIFSTLARQANTKQVILHLKEGPNLQPIHDRYIESYSVLEQD